MVRTNGLPVALGRVVANHALLPILETAKGGPLGISILALLEHLEDTGDPRRASGIAASRNMRAEHRHARAGVGAFRRAECTTATAIPVAITVSHRYSEALMVTRPGSTGILTRRRRGDHRVQDNKPNYKNHTANHRNQPRPSSYPLVSRAPFTRRPMDYPVLLVPSFTHAVQKNSSSALRFYVSPSRNRSWITGYEDQQQATRKSERVPGIEPFEWSANSSHTFRAHTKLSRESSRRGGTASSTVAGPTPPLLPTSLRR
jgi:hypothetical protein